VAAACRQDRRGESRGRGGGGGLCEGASAASSWLVTPLCAGVTVAVDAGRSHPDEKRSRRTLILEGRAWTHPRAPSNADSIPRIHEIIIRRWFHPFACRSLLRMAPSTVWPERDACRSFSPFFPITQPPLFSLFSSLSLSLSLSRTLYLSTHLSVSLPSFLVDLSLLLSLFLLLSRVRTRQFSDKTRRYRARRSHCRLRLDLAREESRRALDPSHVRPFNGVEEAARFLKFRPGVVARLIGR